MTKILSENSSAVSATREPALRFPRKPVRQPACGDNRPHDAWITSGGRWLKQGVAVNYPRMCNLYSLNKKRDMVARFFRVSHNRATSFEPAAAIFPRHVAPVVRQTGGGEREIVTMSWGFMLLQNGRAPRPVTNVRDDKILTSSFWKTSYLERRCLVPASSFCEPNGDVKPATWHWFSLKGSDSRPLFAFPGIWRSYNGPVKKDGPNVNIDTYAFLTTTPNALVSTINHERMPVILTCEDEFATWLRGSADEALALARQYPPQRMQIVQEGFYKEDRVAA